MKKLIMKKIKKAALIVLAIHLLIIPQMAYCAEDDIPPISLFKCSFKIINIEE